MFPSQLTYPQFAPNQVLSNRHLNELFDYLDEQGRLTRTHLIGIGIVCGLEAELVTITDGTGIRISPGCGVSSEGFLIRWDEDEVLEFRTPYTPPEDIDYTFFDLPDGSGVYPMWELTTDRNDDVNAETITLDFLTGVDQSDEEGDEKVLILLLECRTEDNRNCTPNNCDDKGQTVETIVRPVLVRRLDLEEIRRVLSLEVPGVAEYYSLHAARASRLNLPTIRSPRFDVSNTRPVTTRDVFEAYQGLLSQSFLDRIQVGLDETFDALAPLLSNYVSNPFADGVSSMSFLNDGSMLDGPEALLYQYYFDHLQTIIHAYEELSNVADQLFSLCCPDGRIFPRHFALHHFDQDGIQNDLRHFWVSSPAQNLQSETRDELVSLFERLVRLVAGTELPIPGEGGGGGFLGADDFTIGDTSGGFNPFPGFSRGGFNSILTNRFLSIDSARAFNRFRRAALLPIRITPSFLGRPLSNKAIPYYYDPLDLLPYWNHALSRKSKEAENLGFDAPQWNASDDFVRRPLRYDLEPYNFLRIEGAVGQDYRQVLGELRGQVDTHRLPIDILAIRTGSLSDGMEINDYDVVFADLEADYCQWLEQLLGRLAEVASKFYDVQRLDNNDQAFILQGMAPPQAPLVNRLENYLYGRDTLGEFYEQNLASHTQSTPFSTGLNAAYNIHYQVIHFLVRTEAFFTERFRDLDVESADIRLAQLQSGGRTLGRQFGFVNNDAKGPGIPNVFVDVEEFLDQMDHLVSSGDLSEYRKIVSQFEARKAEVLQRMLLSNFQVDHPGLQFKAGTEIGGTFVLIYHGSGVENLPPRVGRFRLVGEVLFNEQPLQGVAVQAVGSSFGAVTDANGRFSVYSTRLPVQLQIRDSSNRFRAVWVSSEDGFLSIDLGENDSITSDNPIPGIGEGTVIADFYLPYRCCGKGSPIYIFPSGEVEEPVEDLDGRASQESCTQVDPTTGGQSATFSFEINGGTSPYELVDPAGNSQSIENGATVEIQNGGPFIIRDDGGQSITLNIVLTELLLAREIGTPECINENTEVIRRFRVRGGRAPYTFINPAGIEETLQAGGSGEIVLNSGQAFELFVVDQYGENCAASLTFPAFTCEIDEEGCGLPCEGIATRASYPLWAQRPAASVVYRGFSLTVDRLLLITQASGAPSLTGPQRDSLNREIAAILSSVGDLDSSNFSRTMRQIMIVIQRAVGININEPVGLERDGEAVDALILNSGIESGRALNSLVAEFFSCHIWEMDISLAYQERVEGSRTIVTHERLVNYTNNVAVFRDTVTERGNQHPAVSASVPSFNRFSINRCDEEAPIPHCEEEREINLTSQVGRAGILFTAEGVRTEDVVFWSIDFGIPVLANGPQVQAQVIAPSFGPNARVLVVDPETGCHVFRSASGRSERQ